MLVLKPTAKNIAKAAAVLRLGGVIVYPTDTAYGLGGLFNVGAVQQKILRIKKRRDPKFTVVAADKKQVEKFFTLSAPQRALAKRYWPGPLSLVVSPRFAVRVPANPIARQLCRLAGKPLIATSANVSGRPEAYTAAAVRKIFAATKNQPELIIDAGRLKKQKPSTVVTVTKNAIVVLRPGAITFNESSRN